MLRQAKGLAHAKGEFLGGRTEEADADELRRAVVDALCRGPERLRSFKEVLPSIEAFEGGLRRCTLPCSGREALRCSLTTARLHNTGKIHSVVETRMLQHELINVAS